MYRLGALAWKQWDTFKPSDSGACSTFIPYYQVLFMLWIGYLHRPSAHACLWSNHNCLYLLNFLWYETISKFRIKKSHWWNHLTLSSGLQVVSTQNFSRTKVIVFTSSSFWFHSNSHQEKLSSHWQMSLWRCPKICLISSSFATQLGQYKLWPTMWKVRKNAANVFITHCCASVKDESCYSSFSFLIFMQATGDKRRTYCYSRTIWKAKI